MRCLRGLVVAVVTLASASAGALEIKRVWTHTDDEGSLTVQLSSDGTCLISSLHRARGRGERVECTYWVHGSRVRIRIPRQPDGQGYSRLDIEHDPESNTLIVHGDKPRTLKRGIPGEI